jgi:hypothetical protein
VCQPYRFLSNSTENNWGLLRFSARLNTYL